MNGVYIIVQKLKPSAEYSKYPYFSYEMYNYKEFLKSLFQIESKSVNLTKGQNYSTTLTIDSTIGRETTILLIGSGVNFSTFTISGPGNKQFTSGKCSKSCRLKIDGLAEVTLTKF